MKLKTLELQKIYKEGEAVLKKAGIEEASIDAWILLEFVTGISRAKYLCDPNMVIADEAALKYCEAIEQRTKRIPLQHITGEQEFMGYTFKVNEHVLIPRQDTEALVEEALKFLRPGKSVLDMCTGSGCILLSLLKMGAQKYYMTNVSGAGVDISAEALKVASENARELGVDVKFLQSNLFENIDMDVTGKFDILVSNPPYIRTSVIEGLQEEVRLHDPFIALDGKEDGLYFYRKIVKDCRKYLKDKAMVLFEIGHDQGEDVSNLLKSAGFTNVWVKKDLAGLDRVVVGMYNIDNCEH